MDSILFGCFKVTKYNKETYIQKQNETAENYGTYNEEGNPGELNTHRMY